MRCYDDHLMYKFCLVFYFSCEYRLCYYRYEHVNGYIKIMCRLCHYWPLPMYPYVNVWIAKVRGLECNTKILVASYAKWCCMVYALLCIMVLREWLPHDVTDRHYVIMFKNVHTTTHYACLQEVHVIVSKWKVVLIFTSVKIMSMEV